MTKINTKRKKIVEQNQNKTEIDANTLSTLPSSKISKIETANYLHAGLHTCYGKEGATQ